MLAVNETKPDCLKKQTPGSTFISPAPLFAHLYNAYSLSPGTPLLIMTPALLLVHDEAVETLCFRCISPSPHFLLH